MVLNNHRLVQTALVALLFSPLSPLVLADYEAGLKAYSPAVTISAVTTRILMALQAQGGSHGPNQPPR